jgi:hypothetical protein
VSLSKLTTLFFSVSDHNATPNRRTSGPYPGTLNNWIFSLVSVTVLLKVFHSDPYCLSPLQPGARDAWL